MDYEKKYNAVLQTAKQWIKDECTDKEKICLECVFPELAESEDERTRQSLLAYIKGESKRLDTKKWIAYLEKQKENPKNADSIPSDCVSNVKCVNRWYKVEDFLPDNGRDVLAKDALGNYLIANYDGDRWYISGYDNEDKPIVYTPAIKEWCDIPSEKQKEPQNKSMAHEDSSWPGILTSPLCKDKNLDDIAQEYVEGVKEYNPTPDWNLIHTAVCYGYHLAEQKEQKPSDLPAGFYFIDKNGKKYYSGTLKCGNLKFIVNQKEQKPSWSEEDEKKRNGLVKGLEDRMGFGWASDPYSREEYIDWLKSLPLNLKKKNEDVAKLCSNEWSEEDERIIDDAYCWLCEYAGSLIQRNYGKSSMLYGIANKLKSLRPSKK